jgi:hypothetical protein
MPLITNNSSLGNLFGGKIATLNFNYQPSSSASSATITVVSENNRYIEPQIYSRIVLPILRIPMRIVEVQYNDDGDSKTLQIELLDELSFTLDKRLILINGVHSTGIGKNEETKEKYSTIEYLGHPKAKWGNLGPVKQRIKKTQYGLLIGGNRTIIEIDKSYTSANGRLLFRPTQNTPSLSLVYDSQERNISAGTAFQDLYEAYEFKLQTLNDLDDFPHTNEWGYTLSDFRNAMNTLGIRVNGLPSFNSDAYFFNNTGTIRSVLSSILSTLGLSFYVHPVLQQIFIISNRTIDKINQNLRRIYENNIGNLSNNSGVTEGTFKKTLKDTNARRLIINTSFNNIEQEKDTKPKKKTFYRISFTELFEEGGWDDNELDFLSKVAGIYLTNIDRSLVDTYIFALSKIHDPHEWTKAIDEKKIYGGVNEDLSTMIDKTEIELLNKDLTANDPDSPIPFWQISLIESSNEKSYDKILPGFKAADLYGAYPNTKTVVDADGIVTANRYAADSPDKLEEWAKSMLWIGLGDFHISAQMSKSKTERFNFIDQSPYKVIGPFPSDTLLSDVSELGYINTIAIRAGKEDLTVGELYKNRKKEKRYDSLGLSQEAEEDRDEKKYYHFIAYFDIESYKDIFKKNISKIIKENATVLNIASDSVLPEQWLLVTENFETEFSEITNSCKDLWNGWYIGQGDYKEPIKGGEFTRGTRSSRSFLYEEVKIEGEEGTNIEIGIETKGIFTKYSSLRDDQFLNIEIDSFSVPNLTTQEAIGSPSLEQVGPFYEINLSYYRPPDSSDIDIMKGLSSISSSVGPNGVTTNIGYSSRKYQAFDRGFISKYSNNSISSGPIKNNSPAFIKNQ